MSEFESLKKLQDRWDFYQIRTLVRGMDSHSHVLPAGELVTSPWEIAKYPRVQQDYYTVRYMDGTMRSRVPLFYPKGDTSSPLMTYIEAKGVVLTVPVSDLGLMIAKEKDDE